MKLKFDPRLVEYNHGEGKFTKGYKMKHLGNLLMEKVRDVSDYRIVVRVISNKGYKRGSMCIRKDELVGAEYEFDADCFVPAE